MAFIGASSAAAAFFFLMARRFIPFIAFAFLPPLRIYLFSSGAVPRDQTLNNG